MTPILQLDIVSAESQLFSGPVKMVFVSGILGDMGIAPGHAPLITLLKPGCIRAVLSDDQEEVFYVSSGSLEIQPDIVTILADTAVRAENLDEMLALEAKKQAEDLLNAAHGDFDYAASLKELAETAAQIRAIKQLRLVKRKS